MQRMLRFRYWRKCGCLISMTLRKPFDSDSILVCYIHQIFFSIFRQSSANRLQINFLDENWARTPRLRACTFVRVCMWSFDPMCGFLCALNTTLTFSPITSQPLLICPFKLAVKWKETNGLKLNTSEDTIDQFQSLTLVE